MPCKKINKSLIKLENKAWMCGVWKEPSAALVIPSWNKCWNSWSMKEEFLSLTEEVASLSLWPRLCTNSSSSVALSDSWKINKCEGKITPAGRTQQCHQPSSSSDFHRCSTAWRSPERQHGGLPTNEKASPCLIVFNTSSLLFFNVSSSTFLISVSN